ncbi:helix-turn-helix domain-containing protein [Acidianus brierleyi]|uniref:Transcription regulator TrmB N-terminal domain-containing protein n=1 Tax=Acidianus brierleyi TaxID=41673 RepID=A0A2U9IHR6_9CREN|nr:helix-turn-helix domain-containing protein [Acidianus brierleyi]AWR95569.1 ArsR family transcriptional regulator [Acidianus brierleyi]
MENLEIKKEIVTKSGKRMTISSLLRMLYGLNDTDIEIYLTLKEMKNATIKDIIDKTHKNKPTVIRSLKILETLGFVSKEKLRSGEKGRPIYRYYLNTKIEKMIISDLKEIIESLNA